jgi:predicted Zn-dependent protease
MNKRIFVILLCLFSGTFVTIMGQDPVFNTLKVELNRNFSILKEQPTPVYYIFLRLDEIQSVSCVGRLGRLQTAPRLGTPTHILSTCLRVGDRTLDNSHEIRESGYGSYQDVRVGGDYVTIDNNPYVLKNAIWLQLDELYKQDVQIYDQIKANMAVKVEQEDKSPDFSVEKVENYYEAPALWKDLQIDPKNWEEKVRKYSKIFDENEDVLDGMAFLSASLTRKIFVDTEGRESAQNAVSFQLALTAEALAEDGMALPLAKTWMAFSLNELPSDEEVIQAAREMSRMLSALKKAPVVESFTGPAILSPEAAGVFFHEIFGHRVEGSRLKQETDAQTFKKKAGEKVLPKHLSVTFDPTTKYYGKTPLIGNYHFDDEGIQAQKVEIVKNGVLKDFLMSRTPIEGFLHSNGHGRAQVGAGPVSRQSNLLVESSQKFSQEELFKKLRKEAKSQGKEYAYYFKDVSGGFTNTNRYSPNAFNVTPIVVYRIYTDGRPDELVRGVDLVGTPLAMFSQIEACGNQYAVFNGTCGAESGSLPVSCVSPALLVKQIETQKRAKSQTQPPTLSKPKVAKSTENSKKELIAESIRKETDRALQELKMRGLQAPFFISYTLSDIDQLAITATNGSIISSETYPLRTGGARLLMGDYQCTDENFSGTTGGTYGYDGMPCLDNDEEGIRYTLWRDLDAVYKSAAETYEQKLSAIKQLNIPAQDLELPDWDKTSPVVMNDIPIPVVDLKKETYEEYVKAASAVFNDYKEIFNSNVSLHIYKAEIYFYNTEKSEFHIPFVFAGLESAAQAKTEDGEDLQVSFDLTFAHPKDLPSIEEFKKKCKDLAENLLAEIKAPKLKEAYAGPILYEGLAVVRTFYSNFFYGDYSLIAERKPLTSQGISYGGNGLEEMIDKRITAKEITIEDLTGTPEYKGVKLLGYTPIDAQAVIPPAKLTLVENGILKTLLNDRVPTPKVPHSNGHSLFASGASAYTNTGVVRLSDTRTKSKEELRKELFRLAKEENYEYAYIVRDAASSGSLPLELYQINIADGTEKRVRSAVIKDLDAQAFKKIVAVSNQELIYNGNTGNLISIIVPDAILFGELQIQSDRVDNFRKPPLVNQIGN